LRLSTRTVLAALELSLCRATCHVPRACVVCVVCRVFNKLTANGPLCIIVVTQGTLAPPRFRLPVVLLPHPGLQSSLSLPGTIIIIIIMRQRHGIHIREGDPHPAITRILFLSHTHTFPIWRQFTPAGKYLTKKVLGLAEKLHIVPAGTNGVSGFLMTGTWLARLSFAPEFWLGLESSPHTTLLGKCLQPRRPCRQEESRTCSLLCSSTLRASPWTTDDSLTNLPTVLSPRLRRWALLVRQQIPLFVGPCGPSRTSAFYANYCLDAQQVSQPHSTGLGVWRGYVSYRGTL
jgi:hypothetical protein